MQNTDTRTFYSDAPINTSTVLGEKILALFPGLKHSKQVTADVVERPMIHPNYRGVDGVDHINIDGSGVTKLGRELSVGSNIKVFHPWLGYFASLRAFWYYLCSEEHDDRIRELYGNRLAVFYNSMTQKYPVNYRAIIMHASYHRIKNRSMLRDAVIESTLPYDCWQVYKGAESSQLRTRPKYAPWYIIGHEEIRSALKEGRVPDFTILMDDPNLSVRDSIKAEPCFTELFNRKKEQPKPNKNKKHDSNKPQHKAQSKHSKESGKWRGDKARQTEQQNSGTIQVIDGQTIDISKEIADIEAIVQESNVDTRKDAIEQNLVREVIVAPVTQA